MLYPMKSPAHARLYLISYYSYMGYSDKLIYTYSYLCVYLYIATRALDFAILINHLVSSVQLI